MENRKFRAAIIGCGAISKNHTAVLSDADYAEIVAFCDVDPARAEVRRASAPEAAIFTDWREMLDVAKPEVVHICTPHDLHAEMACECLNRGINVYLEKPIAISEEELCRIEEAAAKSTAKITVSFQNRRIVQNRLFNDLVEQDGGAKAGRGMVTWNRDEAYYTADDWHGRLAREGGGLMINQAIHTLDMLQQIFPEKILSVRGMTALWENEAFSEVEDNASFLVNLEGGKRIVFFGTNNYSVDAHIFYEVLTNNGTRITGMGGHIYRNGVQMDTDEVRQQFDGKACWGYGHRVCVREFYDAIRDGGEVPVPLASAARTMRILFSLYRSNGKEIPLTDL